MICLREYYCAEKEKTELKSYFVFPAERFSHARGLFFALIFLLRIVTSNVTELLRTRISRRQLVPKRLNWGN